MSTAWSTLANENRYLHSISIHSREERQMGQLPLSSRPQTQFTSHQPSCHEHSNPRSIGNLGNLWGPREDGRVVHRGNVHKSINYKIWNSISVLDIAFLYDLGKQHDWELDWTLHLEYSLLIFQIRKQIIRCSICIWWMNSWSPSCWFFLHVLQKRKKKTQT